MITLQAQIISLPSIMNKNKKNKYHKSGRHKYMLKPSNSDIIGSVSESSSQPIDDHKFNKTEEDTSDSQKIIIDSRITTKDIRDSLWRCRDFELSHLWQRSIFLTTILILCFTGYGVVTMKLFDNIEYIVGSSAYTLNNIALVLCLVNIVFSCLWIMMAKGSKAWYERYERAIDAFEYNSEYVNDEVINTGVKKYGNGTKPVGGFQYPNLKDYDKPDIRDCIFSCKGGAYSPSKINIAIGQIAFVIWCLAFGIHYYLSTRNFHLDEVFIKERIPSCLLVLFLIILVLIFSSIWLSGFWIKSSILEKEEYTIKLSAIFKKIKGKKSEV